MFKRIFLLLVSTMIILGMSKLSFAVMCSGMGAERHSKTAQAESIEQVIIEESPVTEAIDVGNKICPVSGEKIDEKMKVAYEYEGKIYNFCCAMCIDEFKKDPEKYIKKVEEELQTKAQEEIEETQEAVSEPQMPEGMHKSHQH